MGPGGGDPMEDIREASRHGGLSLQGSGWPGAPGAISPRGNPDMGARVLSSPPPEAIPVLGNLTLSVRQPSPPSLSVHLSPPVSSFDKNRTLSQSAVVDHACFDHLSYGRIRELRKREGRNRQDTQEVSETRLASMEDEKTGANWPRMMLWIPW